MDSLNLIPKDVPKDVPKDAPKDAVDIDSIITTAELSQRPSRPPDYAAENRALIGLTQALAHSPHCILQKLAETALSLCRAHSAGVSLLEPDGKRFFWPAVVGQWACHTGSGTPRDHGPCGTVLDRDAAQLVSHPERHFTLFASVTPLIEEALVTPFYVEGRAVGTVWIIAHDQSRKFDSEDLRLVTNLGKFAAAAYQALRESEHRYRRLFETASEGILILDRDTRRITDANPFMTELLGYTREELIGKELFEIGLLLDEQESQAAFRRLREERFIRHENLPLQTKAGQRLEVEVVANLYQENGRSVIQARIRDIAESKRAEEALRGSEARLAAEISTNFRALFEASPTPFLVLTPPEFQIIAVNNAYLNATMTRRAEIIGKGLFEVFPDNPDEREATGVRNLNASLKRVLATRRADVMAVQKYDIRRPRAEGGDFVERWWSTINTPVLGADGEVAAIIHRVEDVTEIVRLRSESEACDQVARDQQSVIERLRETVDELTREAKVRRRAEKELLESEERFRSYFELGLIGMAITSPTKGMLEVNDEICKILGYERDELLKMTWAEMTHPDDLAADVANFERVIAGEIDGYNLDKRFIRKDGRIIDTTISVKALRDADGAVDYFVSLLEDVTERKRAEAALRESEAKYHTLFDSMDEGYSIIQMLYDKDGKPVDWRILEVNPAFEKHIGVACAKGKTVRELGLAVEPRWIEIYGRVAETGKSLRFEERSETLRRTFDVYAFRIGAPDERKVAVLFTNITERKRAEEALRESERLTQEHAAELADLHRRKDEFLAMLSHELRNPLSPILNAAHILRLQKDENPLQQQARAVIERQVNQLSRLVNELLEVSRVITGTIRLRPERLDIRGVVEQAVETASPLIDQRGHQLFVSLPVEPVWLEGDAARLEQVVINLLNNAAKYTQEGGMIWVNLQPEGEEVRLRVRDTGVGIAPELLPHIFDLFTQADRSLDRSQGGLGIGLSLTQRLVELHHGEIEAHSAGLGQGSEFIVRLPVLRTSEMETDMTSTGTAKRAAQGWRILVVDDNVDAANMIAMMLRLYGHQAETVYSAKSALEMAVEYRPDFVVLDIGLPGMDGYEVARRLRQIPELKDTPLIAATGYGQDADRQRSEEAGFDYHLVKPIDPEKLQSVLELLGRLPRSAK
jgi:PAS domain S-box-containing protein